MAPAKDIQLKLGAPVTESDIHSINHIGIVARDLHASSHRYEQMGFTLTPFSPHSGAWKPGEPVTRLGSGNRCVMFEHNYLEMLANENPAQPSPRLEGFLKHHQGGHIICFGSEDLPSVEARLLASGLKTSGVLPLQRDVDTPQGAQTAKFERVQFAPDESPEGYIQAARHLTPEYIYQPRYTAHENGCTALSSAVVVVDDMDRFGRRYAVYTGGYPSGDERELTFEFALVSRLTLMNSATALKRLPGSLFPPIPGIAAIGFQCPKLADQAMRLRARQIPFIEVDNRLVVPAEEASGIAVVFE